MSLAGAAAGAMAVVPAQPAAAAGPPVFLVGDSVMQVFRFSYGKPGLAEVEKGYTVDLDAYQCRRFITLGCRPGPSALEVMRDPIHNPLPPVMVMHVGHNEKDDYPHKIDVIMQEARDRGVKAVVWMTYHNSIRATAYPGNNAAVKDAANRWPEMKVADWDAHAQGHASWFSTEDGLHLTPEGAIEYGKFIKNSIDTLAGGGNPGPPKPAPAKCDAATAIGTPAPGLSNQPPNPPAAGARITSIAPVRLLDTRAEGPDDGVVGRLGGGRALNIVVAGKVGVPANATGVIANVTAVEPCDGGFLTVYPAGSPPPLASSTNYRTSDVVAALVTVRLGTGGAISVYTNAQTDVVVDVVGYFHANQGTLFNAVDPFRLVDTRPTGVGRWPGAARPGPRRRRHPRGHRRHRQRSSTSRSPSRPRVASSRCTQGPATRPTGPWRRTSTSSRARPSPTWWWPRSVPTDRSASSPTRAPRSSSTLPGWLAGAGTGHVRGHTAAPGRHPAREPRTPQR